MQIYCPSQALEGLMIGDSVHIAFCGFRDLKSSWNSHGAVFFTVPFSVAGDVKSLLPWIRDNLLQERPELFMQGDTVSVVLHFLWVPFKNKQTKQQQQQQQTKPTKTQKYTPKQQLTVQEDNNIYITQKHIYTCTRTNQPPPPHTHTHTHTFTLMHSTHVYTHACKHTHTQEKSKTSFLVNEII